MIGAPRGGQNRLTEPGAQRRAIGDRGCAEAHVLAHRRPMRLDGPTVPGILRPRVSRTPDLLGAMGHHRAGHILRRPRESPGVLEELAAPGQPQARGPMLGLDQRPFSRANRPVFRQCLRMPRTFHTLCPPRRRATHGVSLCQIGVPPYGRFSPLKKAGLLGALTCVKKARASLTHGRGARSMLACYCRVSTRRQKTDSQKADIRRWLTGNALTPAVVQWFEDVESGTTLRRPACDRRPQGIFTGTITTVVVWTLDRMSRRQRAGVNLRADWCERGVRVGVITQQLDLSGAVGRLVASVLFGLAEIEHEYRRERQAAGIDCRGQAERPVSRPCQGDDESPARTRLLHERGFTVAEIVHALQISPRTVYRYLAPGEQA